MSVSVSKSDSPFTNAHLGAMFIIRMHFSMKDCLWHDSSPLKHHMEVQVVCCVSVCCQVGNDSSLVEIFNSSISIDVPLFRLFFHSFSSVHFYSHFF